jgi:glucose-6-phosphate isomerase, archaeal
MRFDPGLDISVCGDRLGFEYGPDVVGPEPELRSLDSIRSSLRDPDCAGPDPVYAISMDVSRCNDRQRLVDRMLLFGVVTCAAGRLGDEPVRSQGHVHRISSHSGWSPPELYEIWRGRAVILMQESAADDPGRVYAVEAVPGEKVLVPPGWAHATISADRDQPLTFAALCDREYGFEYNEIRKRNGLAWYPLVGEECELAWVKNNAYISAVLHRKSPRAYVEFGIDLEQPLYEQVRHDPDRFQWVSNAGLAEHAWNRFVP